MVWFRCALITGFLLSCAVRPSGQPVSDTLVLARVAKENGRFRHASSLLESWHTVHAPQAETLWLSAQVEYLRKRFRHSASLYREALSLQPRNLYLQLDYAETLLNMGVFGKAKKLLDALDTAHSNDAHALYLQAKYHYWTGDFIEAERLSALSDNISRQPATTAQTDAIRFALSPWLALRGNLLWDDQPVFKIEPQAAAGKYLHRVMDLAIEITAPYFLLDSTWTSASIIEVTNTARLVRTGTKLVGRVGVFHMREQPVAFTGGVRAIQRLPGGLSLTTEMLRRPSLRNTASIRNAILEYATHASLDWQGKYALWINAGIQPTFFEDNNHVLSAWMWALSPRLGTSRVFARAGYGFSYADARENRFVSTKTLAELLNPFDPNAGIEGIFAPYFTPEHMRVHLLLATAEYHLSERISFYLNGRYGVHARALNPYLYLDADAQGVLFIQREFQEMAFTPFDAAARILMQLPGHLSVTASYVFSRNFFYEQHAAHFTIMKHFAHR